MVTAVAEIAATVVLAGTIRSNSLEITIFTAGFRVSGDRLLKLIITRNMKKFFLAMVLPLALMVSCKSVEEKTEAFNKEIETITGKYLDVSTQAERDGASEATLDSLYDAAWGKIMTLCKKTIKRNKDNSLAVDALKQVYYEIEPAELEKIINSLSEENQETDFIKSLKALVAAKSNTAEGQPFVDFEVDGVKFSDFIGKGKYVLVDFWASWCGPCKQEIPNIASVYANYAGEDFDVLSVAVWDKPEDTAVAAVENGIVWNQIVNAQEIATDAYGIEGIPQIILFGPDGTILKRDLRGEDIEAAVKEALGR